MTTKNEINKYNDLFDGIEILEDEFDSVYEIKTCYIATFHDKFAPNYQGFYYDEFNVNPFKDIVNNDRENEYAYESIDEIINSIPEAKKYHEEITHIVIERYIELVDEDGTVLFLMQAGRRTIDVE